MMSFVSSAYLNSLTYEERMRMLYTHVPLGEHPETHDRLMLPDRDRFAGMYVIGATGTGKTSFLENLAVFDAAVGNALFFVTPHGDAVMNIIAGLPPQCLPRVSLLDIEDEDYPFGLNLFATGELTTSYALSKAVNRIYHVFLVLWPEVEKQKHLPLYLRMAIIALLESPGRTLVDMDPFLTNEEFRAEILSQAKPSVRDWWHTHYDGLDKDSRLSRVRPLTDRLGALFAGRSLVSNIVGQHHTSIDFRGAIERKEHILVKLPDNILGDDAKLIATVFLALLSTAILSFDDVDPAHRPPASVYADEWQNFANSDFERLLTQGRKFGAKVTVANQYLDQLSPELQDAALQVRTIVCLRVKPDDASGIAKMFPAQPGTFTLSETATKVLMRRAPDFPSIVQEFVDTYLRSLSTGSAAVVVKRDPSLVERLNGTKLKKITKPNPLTALDGLFYKVMQTGNPHLPIPLQVVEGLVNGGRGFYPAISKQRNRSLLMCRIDQLPAHFIRETPDGYRWTRRPEDAQEQLQHCIFHVRMTMAYLAEHPIGKESAPSTTNVAQRLARLPDRVAFVRSAEAAGVVNTLDTSRHVTGTEFTERLRQLREQTRAHCCHPRAEIEGLDQVSAEPTRLQTPGANVLPIAAHLPQFTFTRSVEVP